MIRLTLDLKSSAEVLGTEPETFLEFMKREQIGGACSGWTISGGSRFSL